MLCNKIGPSFDSKKGNLGLLFFFRFFEKSHSPCRKKNILKKNKKEKRRKLKPRFDSKKAIFGPSFDSNIYIYAGGSITWPHFGHFKVNSLATSR